MYVGACYVRQHDSFNVITGLSAAHILSDVLLGLVFGLVGGVYCADTTVHTGILL
jgi:hypothetical protein